jgi:penicillin amidase
MRAIPLAALILLALAPAAAGPGGRSAAAAPGGASPTAVAPTARRTRAATIAGLEHPVRVLTDRWGVPHIRAESAADLYAAWGFVTARDRLWQMLATRQSVRGAMWRWGGNAHLQADGGAQLFELDAVARRIWERARRDPAAAMPAERFSAGVNAYLDLCRHGAVPWPVEIERLRCRPDDWTPADMARVLLAMGMLLDLDFPQLAERDAVALHGRDWLERRHRFEELWPYSTIPDSAARRLAGAPSSALGPGAGREAPAVALPGALLARARRTLGPEHLDDGRDLDPRASNIFAVGPRRSASGRPLLANDPHLPLTAPGTLYLVHVTVPGLVDAAGASVPGLPAIVSGRNARCAWGNTALSAVVADVYADSLSRDGRSVRWQGRWQRMREAPYDLAYRVIGVPLPVALAGQVRRYTPHGPVIALDRGRRVALSVRWAGLTDEVDLGALLGVERAGSAAEVCARFRALVTPTLNIVAVDRDGHVRYQTVGRVPRRGFRLPRGVLPGDGRWEWQGTIPPAAMPAWEAPPEGIVVNANNAPLDPHRLDWLIGYDFPQDRALRIAQRLGGAARLTAADLASVQNDVTSRLACRTVPLLIACADSLPDSLDARMRAAVDTLRRWDFVARRTRVAPTLWRGWYGAYLRRSQLERLPGLAWSALQGRAPEALADPATGRPERPAVAAVAALRQGLAELEKLLGPELPRWRYGLAHQARFRHELARDLRMPGWEPPAVPVDGDAGTPEVGGSRLPWNPWVTFGPVLRHVVDLAVAESSLVALPPGNSGDPRSPHARDLLDRWARHGYVPLYLSWERAEAAKESELTLAPAVPGR